MGKTSSAVKQRYNSKTYDQLVLAVRKDADVNVTAIKSAAAAAGESVTGFVLSAVKQRIEKETPGE